MTAAGGGEGPSLSAITARAAACGLDLSPEAGTAIQAHARLVLLRNAVLHLTTIVDPPEFLERHLGESFEGAALLPAGTRGVLLDLGSGNGYPGIPIALLRPGLTPVLAESSAKKAAFLKEALAVAGLAGGSVIGRNVQRTADIEELDRLAVIVCRAAGGWERIIPKVAKRLVPGGKIMIWAGADLERILGRTTWKPFEVEQIRALPGRSNATIALLKPIVV
jgi:16S rRNA (guanine527-N7)-methyltransferase